MAPFRLAVTALFIHSSPQKSNYGKTTITRVDDLNTFPFEKNGWTHNGYDGPFKSHGRRKVLHTPLYMQAPRLSFGLDPKAAFYMSLLALQFACQPILTKRFTPKTVNRSSVVITQDIVKVFITLAALFVTENWATAVAGWSMRSYLAFAALPAFLYSIQNFAALIAYQNLPPLTFNVLNQTKTLSAAVCCYLLLGKVQSKIQIASLLLLFTSACIIEKLIPFPTNKANKNVKSSAPKTVDEKNTHYEGVLAVLSASFISGLAGALTQKSLQGDAGSLGRNSYFFTMEISIASLFFMLLSTLRSKDGENIRTKGFFHDWTPRTMIPIVTNASGAILVGLVTKYAGAVKKGFALIFGLVISGVLQALLSNDDDGKISLEQIVGGVLAGTSLWMYNSFPAS